MDFLIELFRGEWVTERQWEERQTLAIFKLQIGLCDIYRYQRHSITGRTRVQVRGINSRKWETVQPERSL